MAENVLQGDRFLPDGLNAIPELSTAIAWVSFDENKESLSVSGTLHDTQGFASKILLMGVKNIQETQVKSIAEYSRTKTRSKKKHLKYLTEFEPHTEKASTEILSL